MQFKWNGANGVKDLDLVLYHILTPKDVLMKGDVITIPDTETELIKRIKFNGNYEIVTKPKVSKQFKKSKKDKKEEEEE